LADELQDESSFAPIAPMLINVSRRAIYDGWEPQCRVALAKKLRDHQQFGYARKLLGRVRREAGDSEKPRQLHAPGPHKDLELPAGRRLEAALRILQEGGTLDNSTSAETLGLAGAIFKRKWEVDAQRSDLEQAMAFYDRGFECIGDPEREYTGINAAYVR